MRSSFFRTLAAASFVALACGLATIAVYATPPERPNPGRSDSADEGQAAAAPSRDEAKQRARLLHETIHGALLVMHRDLFREEDRRILPSRSLEDVFRELERSHQVEVRWLAVDAQAMSVDHEPQDDFEKRAVQALVAGDEEYGAIEAGQYRHVGRIRLASECLSCHVPGRTDNRDRSAAVSIRMAVSQP